MCWYYLYVVCCFIVTGTSEIPGGNGTFDNPIDFDDPLYIYTFDNYITKIITIKLIIYYSN